MSKSIEIEKLDEEVDKEEEENSLWYDISYIKRRIKFNRLLIIMSTIMILGAIITFKIF